MNVIRRFRGRIRAAKHVLYLLERQWVVWTMSSIEGDAGMLGWKNKNG